MKKTSKHPVRWLVLACAAVFAVAFVVCVVRVNTKYPVQVFRSVAAGETETTAAGLQLSVTDAYYLSPEEIDAVYKAIDPNETRERLIPGEQEEILMVELTVHNPSHDKERKKFDLPKNLESGAWRNAVNQEMLFHFNPDYSSSIEQQKTVTVRLPFNITYQQFTPSKWENVRERDYELLLSLYPEKTVMELPATHE